MKIKLKPHKKSIKKYLDHVESVSTSMRLGHSDELRAESGWNNMHSLGEGQSMQILGVFRIIRLTVRAGSYLQSFRFQNGINPHLRWKIDASVQNIHPRNTFQCNRLPL